MNNEFPTYDDFKEIKGKIDELKDKYDDVSARLGEVQESCDKYKDLYNNYRDKYNTLAKELDKFISENAKLKEENNELKSKIHYILGGGILSEAFETELSETPSVVINTKSVNITFDNHTNNFKENNEEE